jgi:hypothetical protein
MNFIKKEDVLPANKLSRKRFAWLPGFMIVLAVLLLVFGERLVKWGVIIFENFGNSYQAQVNRCAKELERKRFKNNERQGLPKSECALEIGKKIYQSDPQKAVELCVNSYPPDIASKGAMVAVCQQQLSK